MRELIFKNHLNFEFVRRMVKWHLRFYLTGSGTPLSAGVYIIDSCNYRCRMCDIRMKEDPMIYPRDVQERDIDALSRMGVVYYSISGGEPTLVRDLPERLTYAAKKIPYVHLVTNGSTMTKELACRLGETGVREISISIDGTENFHNLSRGVDNAFAKAWNALPLLAAHAPGVQIVVNSLLTSYNIPDLRDLRNRLDADFPQVFHKYLPLSYHELFRTQDRRATELPGEPASTEEIKQFIKEAIADPKVVNSDAFLRKAMKYLDGHEHVISEQKACLYAYHAIEFDPSGNAFPCFTGTPKNETGFGRAAGEDLEQHVLSDEYRRMQKELETCGKCQGHMMLCYYEPRLNFPLHNLLLGAVRSWFNLH